MRRFIVDLWDKAMAKLGIFASFIPGIASELKVAVETDDGEKARRHGIELVEAGEALKVLGQSVVDATQEDRDGVIRITAAEGSDILLKLEAAIDEIEDVATGRDEDDQVVPPDGGGGEDDPDVHDPTGG